MDINKISKDGFYLNKENPNFNNLAFISLRSALMAYFESYSALHFSLESIIKDSKEVDAKSNYSVIYSEKCCQSISNFHHFVELILKDILTASHPLLAIDASKKHNTFYDLVFDKNVNVSDIENTKLLEFSVVLERVVELVKTDRIDKSKYEFIVDSNDWLKKLNNLRNRIAHRGVFILKYKALDYLFGKYALPFLSQIISLPEFSSNQYWKYKDLSIELDPINEICNEFKSKKHSYNPYKIALLKQLGSSAYRNPLYAKYSTNAEDTTYNTFLNSLDKEAKNRSYAISEFIEHTENVHKVDNCPVCGIKALVLFNDHVDVEDEEGKTIKYYEYIYRVQCFCCSFELKDEIKEIDKMNLHISNFFNIFV
jgi:hypothetical protein